MKHFLLIIFLVSFHFLFSQTYIRDLGEKDVNDGTTCIIPSENGFIISGYVDKFGYLSELDESGKILWKDVYHFTDHIDQITDLKIQNDKIIGCGFGYYEGTGKFLEFYFKYDIKSKTFDWVKKSKHILKPSNIHFLPNGNYLMTGDEINEDNFRCFLMEIDSKNGKMIQYTSHVFSGRESASTSLLSGNSIYTGGRYALEKKIEKYRGAISKFDLNFKEKWSNYYLNKKEKYLRNYLIKLHKDKSDLISLYNTNNHGIGNNYSISLAKTTLEGKMLWANEYKIKGYESIAVRDIKSMKDAYYLYGFTKNPTEELFIIKTNKSGELQWARTYGDQFSDAISIDQGNFLEIKNNSLYIIAQSKNLDSKSFYNGLLMKLNLNGTTENKCWGKEVSVKTIKYKELIQGEINLTPTDSVVNTNFIKFEKQEEYTDLNTNYYCYPKLTLNDYDTIFGDTSITIDFLANDIVPEDEKVKYSILTTPFSGKAVILNDSIFYTLNKNETCRKDSFQYTLESKRDGKDTASIYIYQVREKSIGLLKDTVMPLNGSMTLNAKIPNASYLWSTRETTPIIIVNKSGLYSVQAVQNSCIYTQEVRIEENLYSFENVANTNISFLLDVSISMNREHRLPILKKALYKILSFMRSEDKLSIVNNSEIIFDGVNATEIDEIKTKIESIQPHGSSDITKGLTVALQTIKNNYAKGGNNNIIFTTDGDISNDTRKEIIKFLQKDFPENTHFSIFLFNDASIFNEQMQEVVENVKGALYQVTPENVEEILLREFKRVEK